MEKLNELVKLAGKVLSPENAFDGVNAKFEWKAKANPTAILAIAEVFRALEQEKAAAERYAERLNTLLDDRDATLSRYEAQLAKLMPEGCKLVPIEPTRQMMSQGHFAMAGTDRGKFRRIYQAMVAAAPEVE